MNLTLGIITINNLRPQVLKLWCSQIKRLREQLTTYIPAVVVSGEEDWAICNNYKVWHITQQNNPATAKWNTAMRYMRDQGVDNVMITGSDDIISTRFYQSTLEQVEKGIDLIGISSLYFYAGDGKDRGKLVKLSPTDPHSTRILGTGKTVSKKILDQCNWTLWNPERKPEWNRNWGMDAIAQKTIDRYDHTKVIIDEMLCDVKTKVNLNSFNVWGKRLPQVSPTEFYKILSEEELQILNSL
jgi:hypothetical protein